MLSAQRPKNGEPQPATTTESATSKRDLTSWWKQFKRGNAKREDDKGRDPVAAVGVTRKRALSDLLSQRAAYHEKLQADAKSNLPAEEVAPGIFEVPLHESIRYANVAISLFDNEGRSYIYGYVPIIVAKCGVYLKERATEVEGIFRLSGSEKRIKELRAAFNSPERRYGKGLDWEGYTVHDAANILRRYFNTLPEPIIPLQYYERFRDPVRGHQAQAVGEIDGQDPITGDFDADGAIRTYQTLITEIPPLNRQLLLYILDLLAVFAAKSDFNKMTTPNLSAIFQPGILSHPQHNMSPKDYRLSQDVLIFLINNQDHFLIGMQGTAADEKTVNEIKSGPATPTRSKASGVGRSSSNASAGADSIRRFGGIRRNVSVSSRNSRGSVVASPATPTFDPNASGVHRSNTVPSKKSPAVGPARFSRGQPSDPPTPTSGPNSNTSTPTNLLASSPLAAPAAAVKPMPAAAIAPEASVAQASAPASGTSEIVETAQEPSVAAASTPIGPLSGLALAPAATNPPPEAGPVTATAPSASTIAAPAPVATLPPPAVVQTGGASADISAPSSDETTPKAEQPQINPMTQIEPVDAKPRPSMIEMGEAASDPSKTAVAVEEARGRDDTTPTPQALGSGPRTFTQMFGRTASSERVEREGARKPNKLQKKRAGSNHPSAHSSTHSLNAMIAQDDAPFTSAHEQLARNIEASQGRSDSYKPSMSPSASHRSHSTAADLSEAENQGDDTPIASLSPEKKKRWRLSSRQREKDEIDLGSDAHAQQSMSSIGSFGSRGRASMEPGASEAASQRQLLDVEVGSPPKEREHHGLGGWLKGKFGDRRERAKSPPEGSAHHHKQGAAAADIPHRGKSMEVPRREESEQTIPPPQVHVQAPPQPQPTEAPAVPQAPLAPQPSTSEQSPLLITHPAPQGLLGLNSEANTNKQ